MTDQDRRLIDSQVIIDITNAVTKLSVIQEIQTSQLQKLNDGLTKIDVLNMQIDKIISSNGETVKIIHALEKRINALEDASIKLESELEGASKLGKFLWGAAGVIVGIGVWLFEHFK